LVKNRHLAKSIHDAGWGQFLTWIKAYGVMHDIAVIAVPPSGRRRTARRAGPASTNRSRCGPTSVRTVGWSLIAITMPRSIFCTTPWQVPWGTRKPAGSRRTLGDRGPLLVVELRTPASRLDEPGTTAHLCRGVSVKV
jgi:hypothetical protein